MRARISLLGAIALVAAALAVPSSAQAKPITPFCSPERSQVLAGLDGYARADQLNLKMTEMQQRGFSQEKIEKVLAKQGIALVSEGQRDEGEIEPMSGGGDINISASIYREICANQYYIVATWKWKGMSYIENDAGSCSSCKVGKTDAFGIALSRPVGVGGHSMTTWGASNSFPSSTNRMWSAKVSPYGVVYEGYDKFCKAGSGGCYAKDYNFYNGRLVFTIGSAGCGTLQAFPKYGHTWNSAELTSIGISDSSVSYQFSNTAYSWDSASQSSERWVC